MDKVHVSWSTWVIGAVLLCQFIIGRLMGDGGNLFGVTDQLREALSWVAFALTFIAAQLKPIGQPKPGEPH